MRRFPALSLQLGPAAALCVVGVLFAPVPAAACRSNEECKSPRVCSDGVCVNPPAASPASCERDIDCNGEDVCENHQCVPVMPRFPGEAPGSPRPPTPPGWTPTPGLEIKPAEPAEQPPAPPPTEQPPPPPAAPPSPPPAYRAPPPPPPPYIYPLHPHRKPIGPKFDVFAGLGFVATQRTAFDTSGLGFGFDGQFMVGIAENLAFALRGGGVVMPITSEYDVGPGLFMPDWHWGFTLGMGTVGVVDHPREYGFHANIPFEYSLARWLKLGIVLGLGIYRDMTEETIRLELGFGN
jgi:hypothetical protein